MEGASDYCMSLCTHSYLWVMVNYFNLKWELQSHALTLIRTEVNALICFCLLGFSAFILYYIFSNYKFRWINAYFMCIVPALHLYVVLVLVRLLGFNIFCCIEGTYAAFCNLQLILKIIFEHKFIGDGETCVVRNFHCVFLSYSLHIHSQYSFTS